MIIDSVFDKGVYMRTNFPAAPSPFAFDPYDVYYMKRDDIFECAKGSKGFFFGRVEMIHAETKKNNILYCEMSFGDFVML